MEDRQAVAEAGVGHLDAAGGRGVAWSRTERWPEVKALLASALELSADERDAFLDRHCEGPALRSEIDALLAFEHDTSVDLRRDVADGESRAVLKEGDRIGPYRVERRIGRGGMGEVYLATREEDFRQPVAIKLLRPGALRSIDIERFHRERQMLADLDHPGIARLLDGGSTESGWPYMVMEWIDGEPLTRAADRRRLATRRRVELFLQVCDAIAFAHRSLVIHRDLKPANVLLPREGGPKLLDFGIARLLEPGGTARDTRPGPQPLTPRYASPEQWAGRPLTTASDQYSAGLVLAELLLGPLEVEPGEGSADELRTLLRSRLWGDARNADSARSDLAAAAERQGSKPSALLAMVRGDLEAVLLRALAHDPEDRYSGIEAFADDLRRWLDGYPVHARRSGVPRRVLKLLRRRPWTSSLAALATMTILALAGVSQWQAQRLTIEKAAAERRADQAWRARMESDRMSQMLVDLFDSDALLSRGVDPEGARALVDLGVERSSDRFPEGSTSQVRAFSLFAGAYRNLGDLEPASEHYRAALARMRPGEDPLARAVALRDLGRTLVLLGSSREALDVFRDGVVEAAGDLWPRADLQAQLLAGWACARWHAQHAPEGWSASMEGASFEERCVPALREDIREGLQDGLLGLEAELEAEGFRRGLGRGELVKVWAGMVHLYFGEERFDDARRFALKMVETARARDDARLSLEATLMHLSLVELFRGASAAALAHLDESERVAETPGNGRLDYTSPRAELRAFAYFHLGDTPQALDVVRRSRERVMGVSSGRTTGDRGTVALQLADGLLALFLAGAGSCDEATPLAEGVLEEIPAQPLMSLVAARPRLALAHCAVLAGDEEAASRQLDSIPETFDWSVVPDVIPFLRELKTLARRQASPA